SHLRAIAAIEAGRFDEEIIRTPSVPLTTDEGPRRDTSLDALGKLRWAVPVDGTVTAGNSSQMSDGAAAVLVMEEAKARAAGLNPLARVDAYYTDSDQPLRCAH